MAIDEKSIMRKPTYQYWVEFIDGDTQKSVYLQGENVAQIKAMMSDYKIVVIDNTETSEPCYWAGAGGRPVNTYCIKTVETIEHVYRLVAETEDEALALLKTDIYDSEYNFIDEEFKSIEVEGDA